MKTKEVKECLGDEFRSIPGFSQYRISRTSQLFRLATNGRYRGKWVQVISYADSNRYQMAGLKSDSGKRTIVGVHRLLLLAFVGPPPLPRMDTCHGDGNPQNNTLENLRWGTRRENVADTRRHGRSHDRNTLSVQQREEVAQRRRKGEKLSSLAEDFGVSVGIIAHACSVLLTQEERRSVRGGNFWRGDKSPNTKVTSDEADRIRHMRRNGATLNELADMYRVTISTISRICRRGGSKAKQMDAVVPEDKSRGARAIGPRKVKLTEALVVDIKHDISAGACSVAAIARKYGVSPHAIHNIKNCVTWKHVGNGNIAS